MVTQTGRVQNNNGKHRQEEERTTITRIRMVTETGKW